MSVTSRDLKEYTLEQLIKIKSSTTGAVIQEWKTIGPVLVAVYKRRTTVTVDKMRKVEVQYKGLTKSKNLQSVTNRLVSEDGTVYYIDDVYPGLWTNLELSVDKVE